MAGRDILETQFQTGIIQKPTISASVKESGAMDVTLSHEDGERKDEWPIELRERNSGVAKYSSTKCHRGTQTEVFMPPCAATLVRGSLESNHHKSR